MAAFPEPADFNEEEWETLSQISASSGPQESKGLRLELDVDSFVIQQVVKRGSKVPIGGLFAYNLHGAVVVTEQEVLDLKEFQQHFRFGLVPCSTLNLGITRYKAVVQSLEQANEAEDRLAALAEVLETGRAFHGLDLGWLPADLPLLHFCAKHGYAECVEALLQVEGFRQSLGHRCKHRFTLLHLVAWSGHRQVLQVLDRPSLEGLCDVSNEYGELPETSALIRAVELRHDHSDEAAADCEWVAVELRQLRTGEAATLQSFRDEANANLSGASRVDKLLIPYCVSSEAIVQAFRGRRLRCTEFVARRVDLAGALPEVLLALQDDFNLERLVLDGCGLTHLDAEHISNFLSGFSFTLASLELTYNKLGDDGVEKLAHTGALDRVQHVSLGGVGMTLRGLASLAPALTTGTVEKLELGDNDFEAVDSAALLHFEAFAAAAARSPKLAELDLGKTGLQPPHLRVLARTVAEAPSLQKLMLNKVHLKDEFSSLDFRANPFLGALLAPTCNVTRLEVILTDYPELFKTCKRAVRYRTEKGSSGKGKESSWQRQIPACGRDKGKRKGSCKGKNKSSGKAAVPSGKGAAAGGPILGREDEEEGEEEAGLVLHLPMELLVRARLAPPAHPDFKAAAELYGSNFCLRVDADGLPEDADGKCFQASVAVRTQVSSAKYALGNAPVRQMTWLYCSSSLPADDFAALAGLSLVLYRASSGSVMLVPRRSPEASLLMKRLRDYSLSTDYTLQERFGQTGRKMMRQLDLTELLSGIEVSNFSDSEVRAVAHADEFQSYLAWIDAPAATPRHVADHSRYMQTSLFRQLVDTFRREESRRASILARDQFILPSAEVEATRISGYEGRRRVSLISTVEQCLLTSFAGSVGCPELPKLQLEHAMEVPEASGRWKRLLFLIAVPSHMEEGEAVKGTRPSTHPPAWVPLGQVQDYMDDPQLPQALQQLTQRKPALTLAWRAGDAAALKVRTRVAMHV